MDFCFPIPRTNRGYCPPGITDHQKDGIGIKSVVADLHGISKKTRWQAGETRVRHTHLHVVVGEFCLYLGGELVEFVTRGTV
jgi:hypothetical protein